MKLNNFAIIIALTVFQFMNFSETEAAEIDNELAIIAAEQDNSTGEFLKPAVTASQDEEKKKIEEPPLNLETEKTEPAEEIQPVTETPKVEPVAETPKVETVTETPKVETVTETPKVETVTCSRYSKYHKQLFKFCRSCRGSKIYSALHSKKIRLHDNFPAFACKSNCRNSLQSQVGTSSCIAYQDLQKTSRRGTQRHKRSTRCEMANRHDKRHASLYFKNRRKITCCGLVFRKLYFFSLC